MTEITLINAIVYSVISGIIGGTITGVAAFAAIRVEIKYLRRDIDRAHSRLDDAQEKQSRPHAVA